jgi:bifunctional ADP-heptose synthase (sugar kinase/adenylyltransferase)
LNNELLARMTTAQILESFRAHSALIVGDICLDRWCTYDPGMAEPSRETGIPRVGIVSTEVTPGAGGAVANNLAALGIGRAAVLGMLGRDGYSYELTQALNARGILTDLLVRADEVPTFTYTKLINARTGTEDLPRNDSINTHPLPEHVEQQVLDIIFVSDQSDTKRGGVVTASVRALLEKIAEANPGKIVWADSRIRVERFRKMILKPNEREANAASIGLFGEADYERLRAYTDSKLIFVTKGPEGVLVVEDSTQTLVPARAVAAPEDIRGTGDSFSAGAAVALAITGSPLEAARFGNLVASITVTKRGTGVATPAEVLAAAGE